MDSLIKDIRYCVKGLLKRPGFTAVTILTLALAIGANAAIFSLVNAVLLRPLPLPEADRLVTIWERYADRHRERSEAAIGTYNDWRSQQSTLEDVAALAGQSLNITGDGEPEKVSAYGVTANFFPLIGVQSALGRTFSPDEDKPDAAKVAVLSYDLWQRRYGGDREIINRQILLNNEKYSVIGVMPKGFQFLQSYVGIWTPAAFTPKQLSDYDSHYINVVARLKRGVTLDQAQADIKTISQRIAADHPDDAPNMTSVVVPLRELLAGEVRRPVFLLLGAVAMVLLIACANIASLLLSRAAARRKEIALRTVLGASRLRIVRQLLTESILLALLGGTLGLLVATWSFSILKQLIPDTMVASTTLKIDLPVLLYSIIVTLATGIIFGLAPALQHSKIDLNEALKQSGGRTGLSASSHRLRGAFIVAQVALAMVLLMGAGLLMQTVLNLRQQYSSLQAQKLLTMRTVLPLYKYTEAYRRVAFYDEVLERVKALPGVTAAGYTTSVPLQWKGGGNDVMIEGRAEPPTNPEAIHRQVSTDYLQSMGVGLREGRYFESTDKKGSVPVVIVNETFARNFWPNENAIGRRFKLSSPTAPWVTIVGIVNDVRQMGMDAPVKAEMYFPYRQITTHSGYRPRDLAIRTTGNPIDLLPAVREQIRAVDPDQPISSIATMEQLLIEETGPRHLGTILLSAFAGFALILASLGIYGVLSYFVTQQTPDIGVRMALGAQRANILRLILGKGMRLVLIGVALGLVTAFGVTRVMTSLLFGVSATDPMTFVAIPLLLIAVALLACYIPARRATKVDPLVALRYE